MLPELSYTAFEPTQTTLHLFAQVVGKMQLRYTRHRNHWWNMTFGASARGLATRRMRYEETFFDAAFDFIDHQFIVRSNRAHAPAVLHLRDGLSVREFYRWTTDALAAMGVPIDIYAKPYGMGVTTPFAQDDEHRTYDGVRVRDWWDAIAWSSDVLEEFAARFDGKQSPVQLFWHSFDLAMSRYDGKRSDRPPSPNPVEREAYSHDVIAFGFWSGDVNVTEPSYYTYTAPEPATLAQMELRPQGAHWAPSGTGHLGLFPYAAVRSAPDPRDTLLDFFESGYEAGTTAAAWDVAQLASDFIAKDYRSDG
jgi:Family of unknown function (DUF5996)